MCGHVLTPLRCSKEWSDGRVIARVTSFEKVDLYVSEREKAHEQGQRERGSRLPAERTAWPRDHDLNKMRAVPLTGSGVSPWSAVGFLGARCRRRLLTCSLVVPGQVCPFARLAVGLVVHLCSVLLEVVFSPVTCRCFSLLKCN